MTLGASEVRYRGTRGPDGSSPVVEKLVDDRPAVPLPVRHDVRTRSVLWFVDLDDLPSYGSLARFDAADHLGDPQRSLRATS